MLSSTNTYIQVDRLTDAQVGVMRQNVQCEERQRGTVALTHTYPLCVHIKPKGAKESEARPVLHSSLGQNPGPAPVCTTTETGCHSDMP